MLTGLPPFFNNNKNQMHQDIISAELPNFKIRSSEAFDLIKKLLHKNPKQRIGAKNGIQEIKDHKFFADLNWKEVHRRGYKYEKQNLKIDITQSNFEYDGPDKFNIGISIDEETEDNRAPP